MKELILRFLLVLTIWVLIGIVVIYFCASGFNSDFNSGIKAYLAGVIPGSIIGYLIVYFKNKANED